MGTLESITSKHKHKVSHLDHISIPLMILNKTAVETASVPLTDWHTLAVALSANNMLSKHLQLTSNMVGSTHSEACPWTLLMVFNNHLRQDPTIAIYCCQL